MTETLSLLVYVLVLYWSLAYLRDRRLWQLVVVQALSVLLIGFRMSYLLVVQACTILLPLIAFARCILPVLGQRSRTAAVPRGILMKGSLHLVASIVMMLVMHGAYKYANGRLSNREPAYLYDTGDHLAAVWAPVLEPSDASDPRFGEIIGNAQVQTRNFRFRNAQQYGKGFLMDRWRAIEKDPRTNERVARETALSAVRHRPFAIAGLAVKTYLAFWNPGLIRWYAHTDLGYGKVPDQQIKTFAEKFKFQPIKDLRDQRQSLLQRYFLGCWSYYLIVTLSPLVCAFATWLTRDRAFALLLFVHALILMAVVTGLTPQASIRYLQPVSVLTLLGIAICIGPSTRKARPVAAQSAA